MASKRKISERRFKDTCLQWASENGVATDCSVDPDYSLFCNWRLLRGIRHDFALHDETQWFDEIFKQTWKN